MNKLVLLFVLFVNGDDIDDHSYIDQFPPVDFSLADNVKDGDVSLVLYNSTQVDGITLTEGNVTLNENLPTKFLIHGYHTSPSLSPWYNNTKEEYFRKGPHNVIYVDWSKLSGRDKLIGIANSKPAGEKLGDLILALNIKLKHVHLLGHSLGAHLAAFTGKYIFSKTNEKIHRITALDPGGPCFEHPAVGEDSRLCPSDATFVDVIHTDIFHYGFSFPIGHVDFYPFGGRNQPTCTKENYDSNCSHARSTHYFLESINKNFKAKRAKYDNGTVIPLKTGVEIEFGDQTPFDARGVYYVEIQLSKNYPYLSDNGTIITSKVF